jgi:hypothetical protein
MALCWLCRWCMDVISEISKDSIQSFLFTEGLVASNFSEQTDAQAIQSFTDSFYIVLKKDDKGQTYRFIAFTELLLLQNESVNQILLPHFSTSIFPLLKKKYAMEALDQRLPPKLLALFRHYLTLDYYW